MSTVIQIVLSAAVFALFFLPIYLPFLVSFALKTYDWRELRWSLRIASVVALFVSLSALGRRPDYGDDVAGNIAGASYNFAWTWGGGLSCAVLGLIAGMGLRMIRRRRTGAESGESSSP